LGRRPFRKPAEPPGADDTLGRDGSLEDAYRSPVRSPGVCRALSGGGLRGHGHAAGRHAVRADGLDRRQEDGGQDRRPHAGLPPARGGGPHPAHRRPLRHPPLPGAAGERQRAHGPPEHGHPLPQGGRAHPPLGRAGQRRLLFPERVGGSGQQSPGGDSVSAGALPGSPARRPGRDLFQGRRRPGLLRRQGRPPQPHHDPHPHLPAGERAVPRDHRGGSRPL